MQLSEYWNNRYKFGGNSGYGSYGEQLKKKLGWLRGLEVSSITDIGCGDFNFSKNVLQMYPVPYNGYDISPHIIEQNKKLYPQYSFHTMDDPIVPADLVMCVDVFFHLMTDEAVEKMYQLLEKVWTKYLVVTAYERDEDVSEHVRIRKFPVERFGTPIVREIVEEDGKLYFYIFKKEQPLYIQNVSACLITKESTYPKEVLENVTQYGFGEILILTHSDSPYRKYELFNKSKFDWIYYQDDDCIAPIKEMAQQAGEGIALAIKPEHAGLYKDMRMSMGLGWGAFFPKSCLNVLKKYTDKYGEDELFKRETERILTYLNYPQKRVVLPIQDTPSAMAMDRLWRQPGHYENIKIVDERCASLVI